MSNDNKHIRAKQDNLLAFELGLEEQQYQPSGVENPAVEQFLLQRNLQPHSITSLCSTLEPGAAFGGSSVGASDILSNNDNAASLLDEPAAIGDTKVNSRLVSNLPMTRTTLYSLISFF